MRERLVPVFAKTAHPYAGVDIGNAGRFGAALWVLGAVLTGLVAIFVPPDVAIGDAGWVVMAAIVVGALACAARMRRLGSRANVDELLVYSYLAIASIAALVWLSGGIGSPYEQLFLLSMVYTCALHPPRRCLAYIVTFAILVVLPVVYDDDATKRATVNLLIELLVWLILAFTVVFLMAYVRAQRIGLRRASEDARRQARLDPLTSLPNRRAFDEDLEHAIRRALASGAPLSVLVGDLDDFKAFNDRFGHLEGDRVLRAVGESLRRALRRPDVAYRWGGDEFAVILPQADVSGAGLVSLRIEAAVAAEHGPDGEPLGITTGVAELDRDDASPHALVEAADKALLRAKGSGEFEVPRPHG